MHSFDLGKGHVSGVLPITTAKVPILKCVDRGTGVECDISVENRDGILKSQIIHIISSIDERFKKLSFLVICISSFFYITLLSHLTFQLFLIHIQPFSSCSFNLCLVILGFWAIWWRICYSTSSVRYCILSNLILVGRWL